MRNMVAIMQRELLALFYSPIGYVVIASFLLLTGVWVVVQQVFEPGNPASLRRVFDLMPMIMAFIIPAISMRLISEEYRSGTIETLMTAPLSEVQMVLGKYLAGIVFYGIMIGGTLVYLILLAWFGNPDFGVSLSAYLGLFLLGTAFVGFGLFTSSLTSNQVVAYILAMIPMLMFIWFAQLLVDETSGFVRDVVQRISVVRHLGQFNRGLVTMESIVFFLGLAAFFLFATVKVVESKRWR